MRRFNATPQRQTTNAEPFKGPSASIQPSGQPLPRNQPLPGHRAGGWNHHPKKIKKDYEKVLRDLNRDRLLLDQFLQTDLPQFTQWLNGQFGTLLTELRELNQKLAADEALIFLVENEVIFGGGSYARAYQRVMALRDNPEPPPPPPGGEEGPRRAFGGRPKGGNFQDEDELFEELLNELRDQFGPEENPRAPRAGRSGESAAPPPHATQRLKELYRAVVRRLHPDTQQEMTAQKTEWWHQAQTAYEAGDAEQLEVILTLCEIDESGSTAHTSASLLHRITVRLKNSLREIRRQLTDRRRDPAWNFSNRTDRETLADQMRHELMAALKPMRRQSRQFQETIARWKAAAERLKPLRQRKQPPANAAFLF